MWCFVRVPQLWPQSIRRPFVRSRSPSAPAVCCSRGILTISRVKGAQLGARSLHTSKLFLAAP